MPDIVLSLIIFLLYWCLFGPFATLLHELGHALAALLMTDKDIKILLGKGDKPFTFKIGRLELTIYFASGWIGYTTIKEFEKVGVKEKIIFYLLGPLFSIILSVICIFILVFNVIDSSTMNFIIKHIMISSTIQFLATIIPINYKYLPLSGYATKSDGLKILNLISNR